MHITNLKGEKVIVTNLPEAIEQAEYCCELFNDCIEALKNGEKNIFYFKESHKEWLHQLSQLKKLAEDIESK